MKPVRFAVMGDCCVDLYPQKNKSFPGGTAFNMAVAARAAGAQTSLISAIGTDRYAHLFKTVLSEKKIDMSHLQKLQGQTSQVAITLDQEKHPTFSDWELGVLKNLTLTSEIEIFLGTHDIARGVFFTPLPQLFQQFYDFHLPQTVKVGDFLGSSKYSPAISEIEKFSDKLDVIIKSVEKDNEVALRILKQIAEKKQKIVIALLGEQGSVVFQNEKVYEQPIIKTQVVDTTGAGDTYIAYFLVRYKETGDISLAMKEATIAASKIVGTLGAN